MDSSIFHRSLFVSAGNDGVVKLFNMLDRNPLKMYEIPSTSGSSGGSTGSSGSGDEASSGQVIYATGTNTTLPPGSTATIGIGNKRGSGGSGSGSGVETAYASSSCVRFSHTNPVLFAVSSMDGCVYFYDISTHTSTPLVVLNSSMVSTNTSTTTNPSTNPDGLATTPNNAGMSCIAFNHIQTNMFAAGGTDGSVHIWKLNNTLIHKNTNGSSNVGTNGSTSTNNNTDDNDNDNNSGDANTVYLNNLLMSTQS